MPGLLYIVRAWNLTQILYGVQGALDHPCGVSVITKGSGEHGERDELGVGVPLAPVRSDRRQDEVDQFGDDEGQEEDGTDPAGDDRYDGQDHPVDEAGHREVERLGGMVPDELRTVPVDQVDHEGGDEGEQELAEMGQHSPEPLVAG